MATSGSVRETITRINQDHQPQVAVIGEEIECFTLDEMTRDLSGRGLVKIDCEGHEGKVLEGAQRNMDQGNGFIIEVHPPQLKEEGDSPEKIFQTLQSKGYEIKKVAERESTIFTILARRFQK